MIYTAVVLLVRLLGLYSWVLMLYCIISFFPGMDNSFTRFLTGLSEPVLTPIRNLMGGRRSAFDWSPLVAFIAIGLLQRLLMNLV